MACSAEKVIQLREVIGIGGDAAQNLLLATDGSVQQALQLYFEQEENVKQLQDDSLTQKENVERLREITSVSTEDARRLMFAAKGSVEHALQLHLAAGERGASKNKADDVGCRRPGANNCADETWKRDVLLGHNSFRRHHGAPDLTWSEECYRSAKIQADACQRRRGMFHGTCKGPSGPHGQNIYWCSKAGTSAHECVKLWYDEIIDPGYDFRNPGFDMGTGHFTQVVWKGTVSVGMATSEDGKYIVANYYPAGNVCGRFPQNVLQRNSPYHIQPHEKRRRRF